MKDHYPRYGSRVRTLENNLSQSDQEILVRFLAYCGMTGGPKTLYKIRRNMLHFRDVIEKPLDEVTKDDAIAFWGLIKNSPYEEHTKVSVQKTVKRFLKWHYRDYEMVDVLKIKKFKVNKKKLNKSALLTPQDIGRMMHAAEKLKEKVLVILFWESGGRPQEIHDRQWRHVNWEEKLLHVFCEKTQEPRDLPLNEAISHLKRWKEEWVLPDPTEDDYIFPSSNGVHVNRTKPLSIEYICRLIRRIAKKAGIDRDAYTYLIRHSRLTYVNVKCGVTGPIFKKYAGHAPGSTQEEVYVHLDNSDMVKAMNEKVYKVQELPQSERDSYENRIARLEQQFEQVLRYVQNSTEAMTEAVEQFDSPVAKQLKV